VLVTSALTDNGLIDLGANDMIVRGGNVATVNSLVKTGANFVAGYWNGTSGINSSKAANDASQGTALGVLRNDDGSGSAIYSTFDNQPASFGDVLVKYTIYGDANLDGTSNTQDFLRLAQNFNAAIPAWGQGDFNYDGKVNALDFNTLATKFGSAAPAVALGSASPAAALSAPIPNLFATKRIASESSLSDLAAVL
jgi:hypothetical protein